MAVIQESFNTRRRGRKNFNLSVQNGILFRKKDYQRMAHGVFWYGKVQKMNMNGPLADTTMLRSIFTQILAQAG